MIPTACHADVSELWPLPAKFPHFSDLNVYEFLELSSR